MGARILWFKTRGTETRLKILMNVKDAHLESEHVVSRYSCIACPQSGHLSSCKFPVRSLGSSSLAMMLGLIDVRLRWQ